ncbi:AAA family ATPase [Phaeobacter gallaeciensis]|nr:AAA family ATPase [Phaeobacter gallaeciensis]
MPTANEKIICHIDNVEVHTIQGHIQKNYAETWTVERYKEEFPDAPLLSPYALYIMEKKRKEKETTDAAAQPAAPVAGAAPALSASLAVTHATFHETFDLGTVPAAMNAAGNPIQIDVMQGHDQEALDYLPDIDTGYVFNIDLLKKVIIGLQLNMPTYLWGFHGTGKTTILQQASARTKRPFIRVQHSLNMQESDVLGQWTVKDGSTIFQLGPLPMAMIHGWTYCADEYDTAMPNVTTVYQPVLEGQNLIIKDAPPHFRKIIPHPNFRFCATGNTNGVGDETGLYQGTLMQNAANYSRFKITEEVQYMEEAIEVAILQSRAKLRKQEATKIVKFGNKIRDSFRDGKISMTVSPRELIAAAELGVAFGGKWNVGLELAFANRLSRVDKKVVQELMQRQFGA